MGQFSFYKRSVGVASRGQMRCTPSNLVPTKRPALLNMKLSSLTSENNWEKNTIDDYHISLVKATNDT